LLIHFEHLLDGTQFGRQPDRRKKGQKRPSSHPSRMQRTATG
jgi:hypothetical protein